MTFDADPLDLDAEEPPELQGDPRSSKAMSGSVTSPQANIHRLPFFKKVTRGPPVPAPTPHSPSARSPSPRSLTDPSPMLSLTRVDPPGSPGACRC